MQEINLKDSEYCEDLKVVASKVGMQVICSDEEEKELARAGAVDFSESPDCENIKTVASKVGFQVVCDDE